MAAVPQEVIAPTVSAEDLTALQRTVTSFDREQLIWSSGFLAGLAGAAHSVQPLAETIPFVATESTTWTIFYATETGNSRRVAEKLADQSKQAGLSVKLQDLREFRPECPCT